MAKLTVVSPIYSGAYTRAVNRDAAGALSRKKKGKVEAADREANQRKLDKKAARVRRFVGQQRRIAEEYLRSKKRSSGR